MTQRIRNFSKPYIKYKSKASNDKHGLQIPHFSQWVLFEIMLLFIFSELCNLNRNLIQVKKKKSTITYYHKRGRRHLNQKSLELEKV